MRFLRLGLLIERIGKLMQNLSADEKLANALTAQSADHCTVGGEVTTRGFIVEMGMRGWTPEYVGEMVHFRRNGWTPDGHPLDKVPYLDDKGRPVVPHECCGCICQVCVEGHNSYEDLGHDARCLEHADQRRQTITAEVSPPYWIEAPCCGCICQVCQAVHSGNTRIHSPRCVDHRAKSISHVDTPATSLEK